MAEARGSSNIYIYGNITNLSSLTIWLKVRELFFFYGIGSGFPCRGLVFLKARCFSQTRATNSTSNVQRTKGTPKRTNIRCITMKPPKRFSWLLGATFYNSPS